MSDFETHPTGTTQYIKKLEANITRWNDKSQVVLKLIDESQPFPDTPVQLAGEILSDMLGEEPEDSLHIFNNKLTDEERSKLRSLLDNHLLI